VAFITLAVFTGVAKGANKSGNLPRNTAFWLIACTSTTRFSTEAPASGLVTVRCGWILGRGRLL